MDCLVYNCFQSTSEAPGNRDDKCARLSARIEVIVWLLQVQSMKYWAGTSDKGTEHVTYRRGIGDKVRYELAMGRFADYYWDLVDGGGRSPNLPEDSERVKSSFSDILGVLKDGLQEAHGNVLGATQVDAKRQPSFCSQLLHFVDGGYHIGIDHRERFAKTGKLSGSGGRRAQVWTLSHKHTRLMRQFNGTSSASGEASSPSALLGSMRNRPILGKPTCTISL
jgi:hypothetical protein